MNIKHRLAKLEAAAAGMSPPDPTDVGQDPRFWLAIAGALHGPELAAFKARWPDFQIWCEEVRAPVCKFELEILDAERVAENQYKLAPGQTAGDLPADLQERVTGAETSDNAVVVTFDKAD